MLHKFRIILEAKEDIFRDIIISSDATLEDLHKTIKNAFELDGEELASFYLSNENWFQGSEISTEDLSEEGGAETMRDIKIESVAKAKGARMIYVYDFFNLWTFYCELVDFDIDFNGDTPSTSFSYGTLPKEAPATAIDIQIDENLLNDNYDEDNYTSSDFEPLDENLY